VPPPPPFARGRDVSGEFSDFCIESLCRSLTASSGLCLGACQVFNPAFRLQDQLCRMTLGPMKWKGKMAVWSERELVRPHRMKHGGIYKMNARASLGYHSGCTSLCLFVTLLITFTLPFPCAIFSSCLCLVAIVHSVSLDMPSVHRRSSVGPPSVLRRSFGPPSPGAREGARHAAHVHVRPA